MDAAEATSREEEALVRRARTDDASFGVLYDRYVDRVYRYAYRRTRDHSDAEDATAETFRRAFEARRSYEPRGKPFGSWLFGIAANVLRERARARRIALQHEIDDHLLDTDEPADDAPLALDLVVRREEAGALWTLVQGLPLEMQRVLILRYAWDLSYADISHRLGRSDVACKQLAYRALKELRTRVDALGPNGARTLVHDATSH